MAGYHGKYGVILDRHREEYPDRWAMIGLHDRREEAEAHDAWDGTPPETIPRSGWTARREADVTVFDTVAGEAEAAGVYRLERGDDG